MKRNKNKLTNINIPIDFGPDYDLDGKSPFPLQKNDNQSKKKSKPKHDPRNKLNNLNGAEWQFSTKTVINKIYPLNLQHKLRSQHGGQKPPDLCGDLIKIFTKENQLVLDPLVGVGGTLIGAARVGRRGVGIELNEKWISIYKEVCKLENIQQFPVLNGDANILLKEIKNESIDFLLTDVPYWIMDQLKKTRSSKADRDSNLSKFNDKSLQTKQEWLFEMKNIFSNAFPTLKWNSYIAIFIGDLYRGKEYHFLSAELAKVVSEIDGYILKSDIIWHDDSKMLHIYGYPFAYIPSLIHQHILIFRKEKK